ncbi:MAG TPA: plasma-membrane proton-efflux P-type ATPase [Anaerolineae bacterium]|nr:plasma-membrane proton-efflux P-type ATPase [Anaerolineae bacterium]
MDAGKDKRLLELDAGRVIEELQANLERGLAGAEAEARLKKYGFNEVVAARDNPLLRFASKFWGLSAWMLELILVLSFILRKYADIYVVGALLVVNAVMSFAQEQRALAAIELLRTKLHVNARTLRDGQWLVLPARKLVPGDVVRVRPGDFVPADLKLVTGTLSVDQSTLTGESMEAEKFTNDALYSGSVVRRGEATAVVTLTGGSTYYGRTTELVQLARPRLHSEEVVDRVVRYLFVIVAVLLAVATAFAVARGAPLIDMLPLALVLLLGAVPVALPVMFTVSMAVGSLQLTKKGVLVTRLNAVDDAATMDVLCVDKTGTITTNHLTVAQVIPLGAEPASQVLLYGALASEEANRDPIDLAFLEAARAQGLPLDTATRLSFTPFDAETRCTEARVVVDGATLHLVKGAVTQVAQVAGVVGDALAQLKEQTQELAAKGQRTLAVAAGSDGTPPHLVGLVTLDDPPRPDSAGLVEELGKLGIAVKMLTGDSLAIAREIGATVGLGRNVIRASELDNLAEHDATAAAKLAEQSDGFASIYPEGKFKVVKSLQAAGHVVGMTGDGVNDAPALRQAEVGIAVSSATDVAKSAASVVLTKEGLASIIDLVENGRMLYQRIATWIINKVSRTILKTTFVVLAYVLTGEFVVSAYAMMLVSFITDFVKVSLSTDNVRWSSTPDTWDVLALARVGVVMGVLMTVEAFGLLYIGLARFGLLANEVALHTFVFELLLYFALFSIFTVRERGHFWDSVPSPLFLLAVGADLVIGTLIPTLGLFGLAPLPLNTTLFVLGYSLFFSLVVNDLAKYLMVRRTGISW